MNHGGKQVTEAPLIQLRLPYPPSVNHYWEQRKQGGRYLSKRAEAFRENVTAAVYGDLGRMPRLTGLLRIVVAVTFPDDGRTHDMDNLWKGLLDAMEHAGVYENDSQIRDERMVDVGEEGNGWVELKLYPFIPGKFEL